MSWDDDHWKQMQDSLEYIKKQYSSGVISINEARSMHGYDLNVPAKRLFPSYTPLRNSSKVVMRDFWAESRYADKENVCRFCGQPPAGKLITGCLDLHMQEAWLCGKCLDLWRNPQCVSQWACPDCDQSLDEWRIVKLVR